MISGRSRVQKILRKIEIQQKLRISAFRCISIWISVTTISMTTLCAKGLFVTLSINDTQHNKTFIMLSFEFHLLLCWMSSYWVSSFIYCYAECHCTESDVMLFVGMLCVDMLCVVMLCVIMLCVIMLCVIMLCAIMLSVAMLECHYAECR